MIQKPNKGDRWTREEMILVFNLYFKLPYGQMDHRNANVKALAAIMGRTDNSIAMRLNNFASCDPMLSQRGITSLDAHRKQCQPYWDEFYDNREQLVYESERILAEYQETTIEDKFGSLLADVQGTDRMAEVKLRVNQSFFRQMVLVNYEGKCAITGIDLSELLVASHIIPWAKNERERLNPQNGICLSALYDRAFDRGLITFSNDGRVILSSKLWSNVDKEYYDRHFAFLPYAHLRPAKKYAPNPDFLEWHRDTLFIP